MSYLNGFLLLFFSHGENFYLEARRLRITRRRLENEKFTMLLISVFFWISLRIRVMERMIFYRRGHVSHSRQQYNEVTQYMLHISDTWLNEDDHMPVHAINRASGSKDRRCGTKYRSTFDNCISSLSRSGLIWKNTYSVVSHKCNVRNLLTIPVYSTADPYRYVNERNFLNSRVSNFWF